MIQARSCNVDLTGPRVVLISQGGSAKFTEGPPRSRIRAVLPWNVLLKCKRRTSNCNPGNGLGADSSATVRAVAVGLVNWVLGRSVAYLATVTAAGDGSAFHDWLGPLGKDTAEQAKPLSYSKH